jgi:hypothetical protein
MFIVHEKNEACFGKNVKLHAEKYNTFCHTEVRIAGMGGGRGGGRGRGQRGRG